MNTSRKVKNPLLSAAADSFPFEDFVENTLLMPVTPATPAVLRDDGELDNFIGQNLSQIQLTPTVSNVEIPSENNSASAAPLAQEEAKSSANLLAKPSYFTSILSSLPNLSLSSSKSESPVTQSAQVSDSGNIARNTNLYTAAGVTHGFPTEIPSAPHFSSVAGSVKQSEPIAAVFPPSGNFQPPPQSSQQVLPPPSIPTNAPTSSYRLGNQRRLKYAPPPDLTSVNRQNSAQPPQPFFAPQTAPPLQPTIFDPNTSTPDVARNENSQSFSVDPPPRQVPPIGLSPFARPSLPTSFAPSPVSGTPPFSASVTTQQYSQSLEAEEKKSEIFVTPSQFIPARVLEPATPQNTPAANSLLSDFATYRRNVDASTKSADSSDSLLKIKSPVGEKETTIPASSETVFAPISAARVTEKLEHLLAEQNEIDSLNPPEPQIDNTLDIVNLQESDSLTEVPLDKSVDESNSTEIVQQLRSVDETTPAKTNSKSEINPFQQYYDNKQVPVLPSAQFFIDRHSNRKSDSNFASSVELPDVTSFASVPDKFSAHPHAVDNAANCIKNPDNTFPQVNVQAVLPPVTSSLFGSAPNNSQSTNWNDDISAVNTTNTSAPQVQFYNPAQFVSGPSTLPSSHYFSPVPPSTHNLQINSPAAFPGSSSAYNQTYVDNSNFVPPSIVMTNAIPEPSGSATLSPIQLSSNSSDRSPSETVPASFQNLATSAPNKRMQYRPVYHHWFYRKEVESKVLWTPFSMQDSLSLEETHNSSEIAPDTIVPTDGGRFDVDILRRIRSPVYWTGPTTEVRRCSWFYKGHAESRYVPYDENIAHKLEEEFKQACSLDVWDRRVDLSNGEYVTFHSPNVLVHYLQATTPELANSWGNNVVSEDSAYLQGVTTRPRVVKRGVDEFNIDEGEPEKADHILFLVHGIGSVCDLKFRSVEEVVDEFRSISLQLLQSHYRTASEHGEVNRIEVLPISWHTTLHSDTGIDKKLKAITLESIPKLRHFTNDTLLDILFYTSPIYCQTIMQAVGNETNRLLALFKQRNPDFNGEVYLGGHSLGSLILFDLLCHQRPLSEESDETATTDDKNEKADDDNTTPIKPLPAPVLKRRLSKKVSYVMGTAGTGQPFINYPQLNFHPRAFFALGSPIGMFVTVRGIDTLGEDFKLPTCPAFFNIFHPFDPVAYRVESLINPEAYKYRPMLIPHHKGRKRMHLELKETMARVGADLKQKLLDSVRSTWNSVYQLAMFHRQDNQDLEREIDKVVEEQLQQSPAMPDSQNNDDGGADFKIGQLNGGRRIDYVLQEAPFEYINEYIFALTSHVCYWESEDTMLLILKEIYGAKGIQADAQLPQQTLSIERSVTSSPVLSVPRPTISGACSAQTQSAIGMNPLTPISNKAVGPPPKAGFVRKS